MASSSSCISTPRNPTPPLAVQGMSAFQPPRPSPRPPPFFSTNRFFVRETRSYLNILFPSIQFFALSTTKSPLKRTWAEIRFSEGDLHRRSPPTRTALSITSTPRWFPSSAVLLPSSSRKRGSIIRTGVLQGANHCFDCSNNCGCYFKMVAYQQLANWLLMLSNQLSKRNRGVKATLKMKELSRKWIWTLKQIKHDLLERWCENKNLLVEQNALSKRGGLSQH